MISHSLLLFTLSAFLGGGGIHGVVVDKTCRPLPVADSLGVNAIYRLDLRQPDKSVCHQMVSREIFAAYEIGDEFDDRLSIAQLHQRHPKQEKIAQEKARPLPVEKAKTVTKQTGADDRVAAVFLRRQDMMPETEAF
ncbi:MAG TPA: hypothetical protein VII74_03070 [Chthoniobacterales bacterium]